jgi:hypothetical protein
MDILARFRLALKFATVPSDYLLKHAIKLLRMVHESVGDGFDLITEADLSKLDPKKLTEVTKALFAFWMTTYGLDETQLKVSAQLLEGELRKMFPFLNGRSGPDTSA